MKKKKIGPNTFAYPMPVVLVGALVEKRPNFLAVAWVSRVNYNPPLMAVALGKGHYTNAGISKERTFSINIPGQDLVRKTDYCGIVSGRQKDKSELFKVFYGDLKNAPMIDECPVCMECALVQSVELGMDTLFIGEIKAAWANESCLTQDNPDLRKVKPFMLGMPDNTYWSLGEGIGKAWEIGKG